ncbi:hypothetical protein A5747_13445 [Mycobacterium sp. IS-836]|nr:hypothetical protein A5747_13445 [Mycobacterium sp. IS-836]
MHELDSQTIDTPAGEYRVTWYHDEDANQPEDEGFNLLVHGWERYGADSRIDIEYGGGHLAGEVMSVLLTSGTNREDSWPWELRSGAALVRYLRLKDRKGVTLVDLDYRPVEPSSDRWQRVYGVAWSPDDATDPDEYVKNRLAEWRAWAEGDCFGWVVTDPTGREIEYGSVWGYYGFWDGGREWSLEDAKGEAIADAESRIEQANRVGAGIVGLV